MICYQYENEDDDVYDERRSIIHDGKAMAGHGAGGSWSQSLYLSHTHLCTCFPCSDSCGSYWRHSIWLLFFSLSPTIPLYPGGRAVPF
jgi:hypothetical protein